MSTGAISARIARIKAGHDPQLIARLTSGYAILGNQQPLDGCCMLLPDLPADLLAGSSCPPTPTHLNDLPPRARAAFLTDLALLGDAVIDATGCERLNYLMLCNQVPELHGHVIPRSAHEDPAKRLMDPFAAYEFAAARKADPTGRDAELLHRLQQALHR